MSDYRTININFNKGASRYDGIFAGNVGEIGATHLSIIPEDRMISNPNVSTLFVLFETSKGTESTRLYSKSEVPLDISLWQDLTEPTISFQLLAQDDNDELVMKSSKITMHFKPSIDDSTIVTPSISKDELTAQILDLEKRKTLEIVSSGSFLDENVTLKYTFTELMDLIRTHELKFDGKIVSSISYDYVENVNTILTTYNDKVVVYSNDDSSSKDVTKLNIMTIENTAGSERKVRQHNNDSSAHSALFAYNNEALPGVTNIKEAIDAIVSRL